ncbi:hypothetical protein ACIN8IBEIGE_120158 [Acinetobacter sp. 8I-beige]|nr:hypothetical protein ACIN8IBEIGE_120158 [Acinetobacter sp. 8I-beige]
MFNRRKWQRLDLEEMRTVDEESFNLDLTTIHLSGEKEY